MQHKINPVIWILGNNENKIMEYDDSGNSVVFGKDVIEESYNHDIFSLFDLKNDILYSIDLNCGELIINGVPLCPSKESFGRLIPFSGLNIDYRAGLIQYKECMPIEVFSKESVKPMTFNIGYKIDTSKEKLIFENEGYSSKIIRVMVLLSIHVSCMSPKISITTTEERTFKDGNMIIVRS